LEKNLIASGTFPEILDTVAASDKKRFALLYCPSTLGDNERGNDVSETNKTVSELESATAHALSHRLGSHTFPDPRNTGLHYQKPRSYYVPRAVESFRPVSGSHFFNIFPDLSRARNISLGVAYDS
jgi:hypothetical protein